MHEIEKWIEKAAQSQHIALRKLTSEDSMHVENEARARYVENEPRVWWLSLRKPIERFDSRSVSLLAVIPNTKDSCWLIPQAGSRNLPVYELEILQLTKLLDDCPLFEYNLVAKDFSWLVIETDHNDYYLCRDAGR